jgi:hypothetical protein
MYESLHCSASINSSTYERNVNNSKEFSERCSLLHLTKLFSSRKYKYNMPKF